MAGEPAMRFVRYADGGTARYGVLDGDTVHSATGDPFSGGLTAGAAVGALGSMTLLPPVQPGKIVAIGLNYQSHITADAPGVEKPKAPISFLKPQTSLIGSGAAIHLPPEMQNVEYEAEVGFVIGRRARYVKEADAYDYILGLTCANDVSARDVQFSDNQWMRAKGFDTFTPLGPCVAMGLRAEGLQLTGALNGAVRQEASTDDLIFSVPFLVQFLSRFMTLEPGDVVITGTPAGVGKLAPGDTYAITLEGVGTLTNPCVAEDYRVTSSE
jgi:2-keto-4-pentenoate hydratase/2-oxohepta-3-ene-1,7-dioic acid hydratase in catechol pathway